MGSFIHRKTLEAFLIRLDAAFARPGRLYLIGETTQVFEGWRAWTEQIEYTAEVASEDRPAFARAVRSLQAQQGVEVLDEFPGDLVPLPEGYAARALPVADAPVRHLRLYHFDPYSVAFRFIARGSEPDYHLVLNFLKQGWMTIDTMNALLRGLLPRFTVETIQQDPAEFRRRYKGLLQMWRAVHPGSTHRHTPA